MTDLRISIQKLAARYKPIETDGLTLYPVHVAEYETFSIAKPALEVMQQSFPVALMRVPLLSALYQMDYEAVLNGQPATGLFSRTLLMLALSLRLGIGLGIEERMGLFEVIIDRENPAKLTRLRFTDADGRTSKEITPALYAKLRPIIAAQNGVKIESDKANPAIVKARHDKASAGALNLDADIETWISAVSTLSGATEEEIDEWPILKFQRRSDSLIRVMNYIICGIGEAGGMVSYPKGNPTPHPFFARLDDGSGVLTPMGGAAGGSDQQSALPQAAEAIRDFSKAF